MPKQSETPRFPLHLEERVKKEFQINALKNDENMSSLIRKFIDAYNRDPEATTRFIANRHEVKEQNA